jgi:acyl-CoA dehydrogenase
MDLPLDQETLDQLLTTVRRFVNERLIPREAEVSETDNVPQDIIDEMKAMGLYGFTIPEAYGGLGLDMREESLLLFELCRAAPVFRSLIGTNNGIGSQGIVMDGTEEQKQRYLPRMATGELVGSFCLTEPDAGSDAASLRTKAERDGNGWVLNGTKRFITNAPRAGLFTVMARSDPDKKGASGVSAFLVEADTPGISLGKPYKKMGQEGTFVCDVIFEDVHIPGDTLIGGMEGKGFSTAMKVLDKGRIHLGAVCVGLCERLIEESLSYAADRKQFGEAISNFQLVQGMLADSRVDAYAARSMVMDAATRFAAGEKVPLEAACCKYFASEACGRIADRAVQIHGGAGYVSDYPAERLYRDVRLFRIYEGTSQIQQLVIAKNMLRQHAANL